MPILVICMFDEDWLHSNWEKWRDHFLYKSMGKKFRAQGQITPKWIIRSGPNSNSFELLCLSSLPASLTKIQSKVTEKSWRHHFFHRPRAWNFKMTGQIRAQFEHVRDFMPVLVTSKFEEDWIHSNWEKTQTPFSPFKLHGNAQGRITPEWKVRPGPNSNTSEILCLSSFTCKFEKDPIKDDWENAETQFFPLYINGSFLLPL